MSKCIYCGKDYQPHELRPYGPNGALVCFSCACATPARKASTERMFEQRLNNCGPVAQLGGERGPTPCGIEAN